MTLSWFSTLMLGDLDAVKKVNTDSSKGKETYWTIWRFQRILLARLGFSQGFSGAPCLEVEDEEDGVRENERVGPWAPLFIGS